MISLFKHERLGDKHGPLLPSGSSSGPEMALWSLPSTWSHPLVESLRHFIDLSFTSIFPPVNDPSCRKLTNHQKNFKWWPDSNFRPPGRQSNVKTTRPRCPPKTTSRLLKTSLGFVKIIIKIDWHKFKICSLFIYLKHFVRAGFDTGNHVCRTVCRLFHIREVVLRVSIQNHLANRPQGEFIVRPNFGLPK